MTDKPEGKWKHRLYEARASQKCVKCGMRLSPGAKGGHGSLGELMCDGQAMGRISYHLYVDDKGSGYRYRKTTADERRQFKHLLDALRERKGDPHWEREYKPWTAEEMWRHGSPSIRLSKRAFYQLLEVVPEPLQLAALQSAFDCDEEHAVKILDASQAVAQ